MRASGGIFYDPFQTDQYRRALLNNGTPSFFAISAIPQLPFAPVFPNVFSGVPQGSTPSIQDITTVSPDFASLYSVNANVSISREITRDMALTATYLFTRGNRLPVIETSTLCRQGNNWPMAGLSSAPHAYSPDLGTSSPRSQLGSQFTMASISHSTNVSRVALKCSRPTRGRTIDDAPEQNNIDGQNFLFVRSEQPPTRSRQFSN